MTVLILGILLANNFSHSTDVLAMEPYWWTSHGDRGDGILDACFNINRGRLQVLTHRLLSAVDLLVVCELLWTLGVDSGVKHVGLERVDINVW